MTVIAWDLEKLVADGRTTRGFDIVTDQAVKIREFDHLELGKVKGAFCGGVMIIEPWIDHMEEEGFKEFEVPDDMKDCGCSAILVTDTGLGYEVDVNGLYHQIKQPLAYGSGADIAQHYLSTGADAVKAVRAAIKTNASCGGRILVWNTKTNKYHSLVR